MASGGEDAGRVGVTVVNVHDPSELGAFLESGEGQKVILNVIRRNRQAVRSVVA